MAFRIAPRPIEVKQRRPRVETPNHLDFIRSLPCCICGAEAEAAHIRMAAPHLAKRPVGTGEKPDDAWTVPLCPKHHRTGEYAQHKMDEEAFWSMYSTDPLQVALALWRVSGDVESGEIIIRAVIERR